MEKVKRVIKIMATICVSLSILTACGSRMFDKALEQGKLAVAAKEYDKAKASFELALEEKDSDEVRKMLAQVDTMLTGLEAKEREDLDKALKYFSQVVEEDVFSSIEEEARLLLREIKDVIAKEELKSVATINGEYLAEDIYRAYLFSVKMEIEQGFGPGVWDMEVEGETMENMAKERALESAVQTVVASQKAKEMKLKLTTEEKEEAMGIAAEYINGEIKERITGAKVEKTALYETITII